MLAIQMICFDQSKRKFSNVFYNCRIVSVLYNSSVFYNCIVIFIFYTNRHEFNNTLYFKECQVQKGAKESD